MKAKRGKNRTACVVEGHDEAKFNAIVFSIWIDCVVMRICLMNNVLRLILGMNISMRFLRKISGDCHD